MAIRRVLSVILQAAIVAIGIVTLAFILWEPHLEGRNVNAKFLEVYLNDPFLAYAYLGSVAFFVGLYQTFTFLELVKCRTSSSAAGIQTLRKMRRCALILAAFVVGAETYFFLCIRGTDDIAGGVAMGLAILLACAATFVLTLALEQRYRPATRGTDSDAATRS